MMKLVIFVLLLGIDLNVFSQSITPKAIVSFYQNIDIDCYKSKIQEGMESFNKWLVDTFPKKTDFPSPYRPSDIILMDHRVVPIISLNFYDMERFDMDESIYDHLIIDSTLSVIFATYDEKRKLIGLTDIENEPYSYLSFKDIKRNDLYYKVYYIPLKSLLRTAEKVKPDALLNINGAIVGGFGYVKNSKIFIYRNHRNRRDKFVELDGEVKEYMTRLLKIHPDDNLIMIRHSDRLPQLTTKEYWDSSEIREGTFRISGHTPVNKIRICSGRNQGLTGGF